MHVVCEWLGNTRDVALDHYLRVTEPDYSAAMALWVGPGAAVQNPTRHQPDGIPPGKIRRSTGPRRCDLNRRPAHSLAISHTLCGTTPHSSRLFNP